MSPPTARIRTLRCWLCAALVSAHVIGSSASRAEATPPTMVQLRRQLHGADARGQLQAIRALAKRKQPLTVELLASLLERGQPDAVTDLALEVLGETGRVEALPVLSRFAQHRRVTARQRAYQALRRLRDPRTRPLLAQGLRDSDPQVRATAALGLGEHGATQMLDLLFLAFERGVSEAAVAIGKLGDEASVARFGAFTGKVPLSDMLAGFAQFLERSDLPERSKLRVLASLEEVATPAVRAFLQEQLTKLPVGKYAKLRRAMVAAIRRIKVEPKPVGGAASPPAPQRPVEEPR